MYRVAQDFWGMGDMGRFLALAMAAMALAGCSDDSGKLYAPDTYRPIYKRVMPADAVAKTQEGWHVRCRKDRKSCSVELDVGYIGRWRENTVKATLAYAVPSDRYTLTLQAQPTSVRIQIDDNEPMTMRCPGRVCTVAAQPLLAQMQYGLVLRLDIKGPGGYPERQSFALYGAFNEMRDAALHEVGTLSALAPPSD
jgi:hypothetical protein